MINLKVKTLDSQDHDFSVEDEITVRQFKEHIQEKTGIVADVQRLIYCGRVLGDDKPLKEYDVSGKVVHLVQRAPPGTRSSGPSAATNVPTTTPTAPTTTGRRRDGTQIIRSIDGMVLGMAIPMNVNSGTTNQTITQSLNSSSTLCMNRITVARHMLNCVDNIINYLDNPDGGLNNPDMDMLEQTMESAVFEVGISAVSGNSVPQQDVQNLVQAFQGAISNVLRQNGLSNITVAADQNNRSGVIVGSIPLNGDASRPEISTVPTTAQPVASTSTSASSINSDANSVDTPSSQTSQTSTTSSASTNADTSTTVNSATPRSTRQQITRPTVLAEVVTRLRAVQVRLDPYITQYHEILMNDPQFDENDTVGRESAQRIFDRVSESFHYLSHAQHAISDLMFHLSSNTPRHLCCRPILVEHSAYVSSGFAVPNIIQMSSAQRDYNSNNNETGTGNNNASAQQQPATATTPMNNDASVNRDVPTTETGNVSAGTTPNRSNFGGTHHIQIIQSTPPPSQMPNNITLGNRSNGRDANIQVDGGNFTVIVRNNRNSNNRPRRAALINRTRSNPVARLIQAMVNTVPMYADVHVEIEEQADQNSNQENTNNQPRATNPTAVTNPTTATHTRSTARQQAHSTQIQPPPLRNIRTTIPQNAQLSIFDSFLPCNSHHIEEIPDRQHPQVVRRRNTNVRSQSSSANASNREPPTNGSDLARQRADLLARLTNDEYNTPVNLLGSQLQLRDLINIVPSPALLNRIRNELYNFLVTSLFAGDPITDENMTVAINQILEKINVFSNALSSMEQSGGFDARASVENLIRTAVPLIINLIRDDDSIFFGTRLLRELIAFCRKITTILLTCVGRQNAESYLCQVIEDVLIPNSSEVEESVHTPLRVLLNLFRNGLHRYFNTIIPDDLDEVRELLVIRLRGPDLITFDTTRSDTTVQPMETDSSDSDVNEQSSVQTSNIVENEPIIDDEVLPLSTIHTSVPIVPINVDDEPLPNVVIGSQLWHEQIPSTWIPVITRDLGRQRRQSAQAPFSDAYISGMSSKRRKLVQGKKPLSTEPSALLNHTIRQTLDNLGGSSTQTMPIDEALASNAHIQEPHGSYEQTLRQYVQQRLSEDSNYNADRFPNCSKWTNNKK